MSETRMNVGITATDRAGPTIRQLQNTLAELQAWQSAASANTDRNAASANAAAAAFQREIDAVQAQIAALTGSATASKAAAAANVELAVTSRAASDGAKQIQQEMRHVVALFDELARGQRGAMFSTIGASMRDAGLSASALAISTGALAAIMAAWGLAKHAKDIAEWGRNAANAAEAAGMSVNQFTRLDGAMQLLGARTLSTDSALRNFARSLAVAIDQPASQAAQAFHALRISQDELVSSGGNVYAMFLRLANAYQQSNNSAEKSAALAALFRGEQERVIELLRQGASGVSALANETERYGNTLNDVSAKSLEEVDRKFNEITTHIEGYFKRLVIAANEAYTRAAKLDERVSSGRGRGGLFGIVTYPGTVPEAPQGEVFGGPRTIQFDVGPIRGAATELEDIQNRILTAQAAIAAAYAKTGQTADASLRMRIDMEKKAVEILKQEEAQLIANKAPAKDIEQIHNQRLRAEISLSEITLSQNRQIARQSYEEFAAAEREKITEARGDAAEIQNIYDRWLAAIIDTYHAGAAEFAKVEREKVQAAQKASDDIAREEMRRIRQSAQIASGLMTAQRLGAAAGLEDAATPEAILAQGQEQIDLYQRIADNATYSRDVRVEAELEVISVGNRTVETYNQMVAAAKRAADEMSKPFREVFTQLGNQLDQFAKNIARAMMEVGKTRIQDIRRAWLSLWSGLAEDLFNVLSKTLSQVIAQKFLGGTVGQGIGDVLGSKIAGMFGSTAASAVTAQGTEQFQALIKSVMQSKAAFVLIDASTLGAKGATDLDLTSLIAHQGAVDSDTAALIAHAAAASAGSGGNVIGGLAGALNPLSFFGFAGLGFERGGVVPSARGGMVVGGIRGGQLSILHSEEMVLPVSISRGLQNLISAGGVGGSPTLHFNLYSTYADAQGISNMFKTYGGSMAASFAMEVRRANTRLTSAAVAGARGLM